jgi:acyl carrier protein
MDATERMVFEILHELTAIPVERIQAQHKLVSDLGMDSVRSMEMLGMLEEKTGIQMDLEAAMAVEDVASVIELVRVAHAAR